MYTNSFVSGLYDDDGIYHHLIYNNPRWIMIMLWRAKNNVHIEEKNQTFFTT